MGTQLYISSENALSTIPCSCLFTTTNIFTIFWVRINISCCLVILLHISPSQLGIREFVAIIDKRNENKRIIHRLNQFLLQTLSSLIAPAFSHFIQINYKREKRPKNLILSSLLFSTYNTLFDEKITQILYELSLNVG